MYQRDLNLIRVLDMDALLAGAPYSSEALVLVEATGEFFYTKDGAAPSTTSLVLGPPVDSSVPGAVVATSGSGSAKQTTITLTDLPVPIVSVTTGAGIGGTEVYEFPQGYAGFLGCVANLTGRVAVADQADFTDATPEGDIGVGSLAITDADAFGTDATDDDYATGAAFIMAAYAFPNVVCPPEAARALNNSVTPNKVFVNALVDAGDIDDSVTTEILISGTIVLSWNDLGAV